MKLTTIMSGVTILAPLPYFLLHNDLSSYIIGIGGLFLFTFLSLLPRSGITQNLESAKAAAAKVETAEIDSQNRGVDDTYDIPYRPAYKEMTESRRETYAREAYDLGCRSTDDIFSYMRSQGVTISNTRRDWCKFLVTQWDNQIINPIQL
jgi:hypothetical protein